LVHLQVLGHLDWQMDVCDFSASAASVVVAEGAAVAAAKTMTVALQLVKVDSEADGSMTGLPVYLRYPRPCINERRNRRVQLKSRPNALQPAGDESNPHHAQPEYQ
jgi:hypothetical protein